MSKDSKAETKDAKIAWDGQIEPEPEHGGDWFWGGDPPPATEPLAKGDKPKS